MYKCNFYVLSIIVIVLVVSTLPGVRYSNTSAHHPY